MDFKYKEWFLTHRFIPHDKWSVDILFFVQTTGANKASRHFSELCFKTYEVLYTDLYYVGVQTTVLGYKVLCKICFQTDELQYTDMYYVCVQTNELDYTVLCKVFFQTDEVQYTDMYYVCVQNIVLGFKFCVKYASRLII